MSFSAARIPVAKSMGFRERRFSTTKDPSESGEFFAVFSPPRCGYKWNHRGSLTRSLLQTSCSPVVLREICTRRTSHSNGFVSLSQPSCTLIHIPAYAPHQIAVHTPPLPQFLLISTIFC